VLPLFAVTLFVSASLLFLVQPMVGKMILPRLGGTPAVWNTCMFFFQGVLLIGYAYTHTLSTWQNRRRQVLVQMVVLLLPLLGFLPFGLGIWEPPAEENPIRSVLWLLLGMIGLPFFVVSTSAPLLQRWFASTSHRAAKDPYFLYGASNLGSMLALLLYPLVVEPSFSVETQAVVWTGGYVVFVLLVMACAAAIWRSGQLRLEVTGAAPPQAMAPAPTLTAETSAAVTAKPRRGPVFATAKATTPLAGQVSQPALESIPAWRRLRWIGLAAVPSSLMLGMTTYLTTDIAAIPFFWVIPLALYLLTFILVFARWPLIWSELPHDVILYAQPFLLMLLVVVLMGTFTAGVLGSLIVHSLAFFFIALMCHGELARDRPDPRHLTEFYLWMSVGGVLGGLFNGLVAPLFFRVGNIEYPLAMVLACLLRPPLLGRDTLVPGDSSALEPTRLGRVLDFVIPLIFGAVFLAYLRFAALAGWDKLPWLSRILTLAFAVSWAALLCRPLRFGLALGALFLVLGIQDRINNPYTFQDRGFFGFVKVRRDELNWQNEAGQVIRTEVYHTLVHGGINHGMQNMSPGRRREPITYFHPTSGIGQIFEQLRWSDARLPASPPPPPPC
jgi:hypothetical protein